MNIGVIGVNTTQTKEQVFPGNLAFKANGKTLEIKISDSRERIQSAVTAVKKAGSDVVVALIHEGFSQTSNGKATGKLIDYARSLTGVSAIYGGQSHLFYNAVVNGVTVAQTKNAVAKYTRTAPSACT